MFVLNSSRVEVFWMSVKPLKLSRNSKLNLNQSQFHIRFPNRTFRKYSSLLMASRLQVQEMISPFRCNDQIKLLWIVQHLIRFFHLWIILKSGIFNPLFSPDHTRTFSRSNFYPLWLNIARKLGRRVWCDLDCRFNSISCSGLRSFIQSIVAEIAL